MANKWQSETGVYAYTLAVLDVEKEWIPLVKELVPTAEIECKGPRLPLAYDFDESGLGALLGGAVPKTEPKQAIESVIEHFRRIRNTRYWHERDIEPDD